MRKSARMTGAGGIVGQYLGVTAGRYRTAVMLTCDNNVCSKYRMDQ